MLRTFFLLLMLIIANKTIGQYGSLLVICDPGYRVYIDDALVGFTNNDQDGLFIEKIEVGEHSVRVVKKDFLDKTYQIVIEELKTVELEVDSNESFDVIWDTGFYLGEYRFESTGYRKTKMFFVLYFTNQSSKKVLYFFPIGAFNKLSEKNLPRNIAKIINSKGQGKDSQWTKAEGIMKYNGMEMTPDFKMENGNLWVEVDFRYQTFNTIIEGDILEHGDKLYLTIKHSDNSLPETKKYFQFHMLQ